MGTFNDPCETVTSSPKNKSCDNVWSLGHNIHRNYTTYSMIIGHFWDASVLGWFSRRVVRVDKKGAGFSMVLTSMLFLARILNLI